MDTIAKMNASIILTLSDKGIDVVKQERTSLCYFKVVSRQVNPNLLFFE